ncbi:Hypothetical predicted protein [Paramuricea clavata]|uniref:Uncharacterized protein n=1 Tax=Paramuricea clavata TaxID=317549 RepID=A0A7D9MMN4_PARCT|nr:Hypothetical predicted protein [Paramuricea clavata]
MAESAVKITKNLLQKCKCNWEEFVVKLRELRNMPRSDGNYPSELLMGYKQRCLLPSLNEPEPKIERREKPKERKKDAPHPRRRRLIPGEKVICQNPITKKWDDTGLVVSERKHGGSYWIETRNGWQLIRNRRFLKPLKEDDDSKNTNHTRDQEENEDTLKTRRSPRLVNAEYERRP